MKILLLVALIFLGSLADGYKILCIFGIPSKSHTHLAKGIVNALLKAGHEVTWVTPFPPKDSPKGLTIIDGSATTRIATAINMLDKRNSEKGFSFVREFATNISLTTASLPALRDTLVKEQFDAVITETFFNDMDAGYAAVLQIPWIMLSGVVLQPTVEALVDDVKSLPMIPLLLNDFPIPMNFWHRLVNVGMYTFMQIDSWWNADQTSQIYESHFKQLALARGHSLPPLEKALNNVSILFVNSHSSFAPAQSVPPNVVDIGGYHIEETIEPLPKDLQDLLDSSTQGVIYFSMGSVIQSSNLPVETRLALIKMFGELPYTVLWKFEEKIDGLPKNVHIRAWMPQPAILAHKNTRVFITHGGLLSTLETLHYGVPIVAVPVFGDQPANAARAVRAGYALKVDYNLDTMVPHLKAALKEILEKDSYYKRAKYLSFLFNNRPVAPSKLISHYVELAIETKGAYHLRSKSKQYEWYQKWMLDLLAFIVLILYIIYKIIKIIINLIFSKSKTDKNVKAKRN